MPEFDLTVLNETDRLIEAKINFIGQSLNIDAPKMYLTNFSINSNVPVYIPRIIPSFDSSAFVGGGANVTTNSQYSRKKWNTNLAVCVSYNGSYSNQSVKYEPVGNLTKEPPNVNISRSDVVFNPYFHHYNTLSFCRLIQAAINQGLLDVGLSIASCRITKENDKFNFLIEDTVDIQYFSLYFNYDLNYLFYLDSIRDQYATEDNKYSKLIFDEEITHDLGKSYYIASILALTTTIFPFKSINFSSSTLEIESVTQIIQGSTTAPTEKIIYSYNMNASDPDSIARNVNFASTTYFRGKVLEKKADKIALNIYWSTADGLNYPVYLDKYQYCSLTLDFND